MLAVVPRADPDTGANDVCGIAGYVGADAAARADGVGAALERMAHRGPDGMGWHEDDGVVIGMCRLAIVGLVGGDQPVFDEDGTRVVVCNGEIYNHVELRAELGARHTITSTSDAAVIPHLHEDDPHQFVRRLRGMFAFALWDGRARRLTLARDRLGKKPLFWSATPGDGLAFASELPALREIVGRHQSIDEVAVHHYLALGMIPGPRTVYRGVSALPVASRLDVGGGRGAPEVRIWGRPPEPLTPVLASGESLLDAIDEKLTEAVRLRLRSDVPVGVMLSGGIDSGLVAAYAARAGARDLHAFVVRTHDPRYDETELARRTAGRWGLPIDEVDLGGVDEATVRAAVGAHGQPFGDPSAVPSWLLARAIAPHRKCVLVGDGGDEIFAGYRRYTLVRWLARLPRVDLRRLAPTGDNRRSLVGFARRAARISGVRGPDAYQLLTTDLVTPALMSRAFPQLVSEEAGEELRQLLPVDPFADGGKALMRADRDLLLAWDLLPKMDIATMSHGVEARSPFLDSELVALASSIPASRVVGRWTTKPLLRALARRHLPPEVARAPKRGFEVPLDRWLAGPLRQLMEDTLLAPDASIGQFAELSTIRRIATGGDDRVGARPHLAWALLVLELFLRGSTVHVV